MWTSPHMLSIGVKDLNFAYTCDNKRYHTLNYHNLRKFGRKIHKAVLECGFTCPNIDGSKGEGGCAFCDSGSGYFTKPELSLQEQLSAELSRLRKKYDKDIAVNAYFQANTNTYAPTAALRRLFEQVLSFPEVVSISIGTRADCLPDDVLELLSELNERTYLTVELGMQTVHDVTKDKMNICCTHEEFLKGYMSLKGRGIRTCLHIINGLPGETQEMMLETAKVTAKLCPEAVKLQMLHTIRGTRLAEAYLRGEFTLMERDEYISLIVKQLELLPPETVIERITGDGDKSKLIAPKWTADKLAVLGGIDKKLAELDTWQGRRYCI